MDVKKAIDYVFTVLKYSGHYPLENGKNPSIRYLILFYIIYGAMLIVESVQLIIAFGDIDRMVEASFLFATHIGVLYKSYMFVKSPAIYRLTQDLYRDMHRPKNMHKKEIANEAKKTFGLFIFFYTSFACFACFFIFAAPILHNMKALPVDGWYPFDVNRPVLFELAYLQQASAVCIIALITIALDSVFITLIVQLCVQLDFLKNDILNINKKARRTVEVINEQRDFTKVYRVLIAKSIVLHQNIIR